MEPQKDIRIVVHQRGWVLVGEYSQDGDKCRLDNAAVIRRWGTTKGLPELADGPTRDTVLDRVPGGQPVNFHVLTGLFTIGCNPEKWAPVLGR
jgi:hypothetical protein